MTTLSRVTPDGWVIETGDLSRVLGTDWVIQSQRAPASDGSASGALPNVTITPPSAIAIGTSGGGGDPEPVDGAAAGPLPNITISAPSATAIGTSGVAGSVTIPPIEDYGTRTVLKNVPNITVDFYNISTKQLVVSVTGITSNATTGGAVAASTLLVAGVTYRTVVEFTYGGLTYRGIWNLVAA